MGRIRRYLALVATTSVILAACSGGTPSSAPSGAGGQTAVRLQLQWFPQAQFAGYFAAQEQGYFAAEGLDVTFYAAGPTIAPQTVGSAPNGPEFTIAWVPKVLQAREAGSDLVNIAQVFQRSGTLSVSWKDSNITKPADFKGKKVGVWDFGNEFEVTAGAKMAGLEQGTDYTKVIQDFNMALLLSREIDVAEAMIYNEYAQVLETKDPATGQLYKPEQLNVINWNEVGSAMLQDALHARAAWLAQPGNEDIAKRFLKASFRGWIYCRDHAADCTQYALNAGSQLPKGHQAWMMSQINPLVWPSPNGIGIMDAAEWQQTVDVSLGAAIIKAAPPSGAYRTDLAEAALKSITEDAKGADFKPVPVPVTEGGN